jgi:hypothetical protein
MFKGLFMMGTSIFLGGFSFLTLAGLRNTFKGTIEISPKLHSKYRSFVNKRRRDNLVQTIGEQPTLNDNLREKIKKSSNLEAAKNDIFNDFKNLQEANMENPPVINIGTLFNPNPIINQRPELYYKFREMELSGHIKAEKFIPAIELFNMLYPEGYAGFADPVLGLGTWGSEKGLNTGYLSFWGGLDRNVFDTKKNLIKHNLDEIKKIQSNYIENVVPKLVKTIDASDIDRLNNIIEELNNIKDPDLDSLKTIIKDFGYLNENFLKQKLSEAGEGDLFNDLERQIYRLCLDQVDPRVASFYPHDPSLKFPLTSEDKADTKAIKSLLNIIYKYEEDIVSAARNTKTDMSLFLVEGENKLNPSNLDESRISNENLGKLLDISSNTINRMLDNINNPTFQSSTPIDLKLFISNSPFYNSIPHVQELMILTLNQFIFNDITPNTLYIFSKYSHDTFGIAGLSEKLGISTSVLRDLSKTTKAYTMREPFFRFLVNVYLADPASFNLKGDNYKDIKEELCDEVFHAMVRKELIKDKSFRLDFDAIFHTELFLTELNKDSPVLKHGIYPLSKLAGDMGYRENLFSRKFKDGSRIGNELVEAILLEIDIPGGDYDLYKLAKDRLYEVKKRNGPGVRGGYTRFWSELYSIQVVEFLKITLGLDIWGLVFIKDATRPPDKNIYKIDIERHHLERIKSLYTIFKFSGEYIKNSKGFTKDLPPIPFVDFVNALAPIMKESHDGLHISSQYTTDMQMAMYRLMHLYELIQRPFQNGVDLNEFRGRTAIIDNEEVFVWEDLDNDKIEEWIERWEFVKEKGYEAFLLNNKIGYPKFYNYRYKPMEEDFRLFLNKEPSAKPWLFHSKGKRRDVFWEWFLRVYLRENIYPIIKPKN